MYFKVCPRCNGPLRQHKKWYRYLGELLDMLADIYQDDGDKAEKSLKYVDFQKESSALIS